MSKTEESLLDAVRSARAEGQPVVIAGSGSKAFLTGTRTDAPQGRLLSTEEHLGIADYRPDELVVTVRSGTPLRVLNQALAHEGQMLGFEPPEFRGLGTVGGAVACGLAGPGRVRRGGVRDSVLGVKMINGLGERLVFGGQVMKNVAGFDVSRLQAGAFGTLGLLLEVSLKVMPIAQSEQTRRMEIGRSEAHALMLDWSSRPHPITATAYLDNGLWYRLSGAEAAVIKSGTELGGELQPDNGFWQGLRDQSLPFFREGVVSCRHVAPAVPLMNEDVLLEWNGARRWANAASVASDYRPFSTGYAGFRVREAGGDPTLATYQARLKAAFDPDNLFNQELTDADVAA